MSTPGLGTQSSSTDLSPKNPSPAQARPDTLADPLQMKEGSRAGGGLGAPVQAHGGSAGAAGPPPPSGGGSPLPRDVQAKMEGSFGEDFSGVRVHESPSASAMGAQAYASGNDVTFAPGQYQPKSEQGQALLGHELAHVVQQKQGRVPGPQGKGGIVQDAGLEREADVQGAKAARGEPASAGAAQARAAQPKAGPVNLNKALASGQAKLAGNTIQLKDPNPPTTPTAPSSGPTTSGGGQKTDYGGLAPAIKFEVGGQEVEIGWENGPQAEITLKGWQFPKDGWELRQNFPVYFCLGIGGYVGASIGGGFELGGKLKFKATKKDGNWEIGIDNAGGYAKAEIWGEVTAGVFAGMKDVADVSVEAFGRVTAEAVSGLGVNGLILRRAGAWGGSLGFNFNIEAAIKAALGVRVVGTLIGIRKTLLEAKIAEWTIASAGMRAGYKWDWAGGGAKAKGGYVGDKKPYIKWGKPPEL